MAALGWGPSAGRERQGGGRVFPRPRQLRRCELAARAISELSNSDRAPTQNVNDIPISIFRVPSTLVGCLKNGDVIVPL